MFAHSSDTVKKSNPEEHIKIINVCVKGLQQALGAHSKI